MDATVLIPVLVVLSAAVIWTGISVRRVIAGLGESGASEAHALLQQQLDGLRQQVAGTLDGNQRLLGQQLHQLNQSIDERLRSTGSLVNQVHSRLGEVSETVRHVHELGKDISSLQEILRAPKLRGGLGELFLEDLLARMLPSTSYGLQHTFRSGQRVDAVVRVGERLVPVDAKFPLENFKRIIEAAEAEQQVPARRAFLSDVRKHIDKIAASYILPEESTFDFALMYIPAENVYYETIVRDEGDASGLFEYAVERRVIPVSPNSFYAYLQVIVLGLKGLQVEETARELLGKLGGVRKDFTGFQEKFELAGRHLNNSRSAYDEAEKRLNRLGGRLDNLAELKEVNGGGALPVSADGPPQHIDQLPSR